MMHPLSRFLTTVDEQPDAELISQGEDVFTRLDILNLAGRITEGLRSQGVEPGQKIMLMMPNSVAMAAALPAIWSLGALPMFLSAKATQAQKDGVVSRHNPALILDAKGLDDLIERCTATDAGLGERRPDADADASVIFTSGSSGLPKGVVQKGRTLTSGVGRVARTLGYAKRERILVPIPFAHDYGWGQLLSGLVAGHLLILPKRDILADVAHAINLHQPTVFAGVPSLYSALLFGISGFETAQTESLRLITSTGSAFSPKLYDALCERIPQARVLRNYGLTETYRSCCLPPEQEEDHPGTVGRPIEGVEIRIADTDGHFLPAGTEGEVVHLGEGVFDRYLNDPEATEKVRRVVDGQPAVFTGDVGRLDAEGFLTLLGRRDRLIKSMDIRVNLNDVEEAMSQFVSVDQVAVLSRNHPVNGVEIVAFCVPSEEAELSSIKREANRNLPPYMRPRMVTCLEEMPRTSVGKVDYPALKKQI